MKSKTKSEFPPKYKQLLKRVASNIKEIRNRNGMSQEDFVDHGLDLRWFQRLESGEHSPSLPTLFRIAEILKVDIEDLTKK